MADNPFAAPSWWKPLKANTLNAAQNALIPYMSSEDQRATGTKLKGVAGLTTYANAPFSSAPTQITPNIAQNYLSSARASQAIQSLQKAGVVSGAGYKYLTGVLKTLQRLGGNGGAMSRANYQELVNAITAMDTDAKANTTLKPWIPLAQAIVAPAFSAGGLANQNQTTTGRTVYGAPNTSLFG